MNIVTDLAKDIVKPELLNLFIEKYKDNKSVNPKKETNQKDVYTDKLKRSRRIIRKAYHRQDLKLLEKGFSLIREAEEYMTYMSDSGMDLESDYDSE